MNSDTLKFQIALTLVKGVGHVTAKTLLAYVGNVEDIFKQKKQSLVKIPNVGEYIANQILSNQETLFALAEKEVDFILKNKITPLFFTDKQYPFRLKECVDAPILIYSKGNQDFNQSQFIGVVGTRKATDYGKDLCINMLQYLSTRYPNLVVVSGLAYGVDICAHKAALEHNLPTIGVLSHGLDRIYPAVHRPIAVKMLSQGGLLTEYMSGTNPDKQNFVQRNRIIAGLTDVLIVVESADKGGALITAEIANSYNRDVFAFPGKVGDAFSSGCNKLIKQNKAALIENAKDLELFMGWESLLKDKKRDQQPTLFVELTEQEQSILSLIKANEMIHVNLISIKTELPMSKLAPSLLEMEFKGLLKCFPGNLYKALL